MDIANYNAANIIELVQSKVTAKYGKSSNFVTSEERQLAQELFDTLERLCKAKTCEIETENVLVREIADESDAELNNGDKELDTTSSECATASNSANTSDYQPSPIVARREKPVEERFTLEEMSTIVGKKKDGWALTTIMHHYRKVKSSKDITVMRKILEGQPRKHVAFKEIRDYVFSKFLEYEKGHQPIHDCDLQSWALSKAAELDCSSFVASESWVYNFKKKYGIPSGFSKKSKYWNV